MRISFDEYIMCVLCTCWYLDVFFIVFIVFWCALGTLHSLVLASLCLCMTRVCVMFLWLFKLTRVGVSSDACHKSVLLFISQYVTSTWCFFNLD